VAEFVTLWLERWGCGSSVVLEGVFLKTESVREIFLNLSVGVTVEVIWLRG
jgi:hypothetical protein